jgi:hypothetical protein
MLENQNSLKKRWGQEHGVHEGLQIETKLLKKKKDASNKKIFDV